MENLTSLSTIARGVVKMHANLISNKNEIKRIPTYIEGLDEKLQGGIPEGHITLICGTAGTMKSSIAFNVLFNEALKGKTGVYLSLEQSYVSLLNHMVNLDYKLDQVNIIVLSDISKLNESIEEVNKSKGGTVIVSDLSAIRKQVKGMSFSPGGDWINIIKNIIKKLKEKGACDLFVLDSMSALYVLSQFDNPRSSLFYIFEFLRDLGVTSFLLSEMPLNKSKYSEYEVEDYLADGIIVLELAERQRKVTRELAVVKMRATAANTDVHTLEFKSGKFRVMYGGQPPLL